MLVLSRSCEETIMIGDSVEITVLDIRGDRVRLGVRAPNTIPVHRKEVYLAIQKENAEAVEAKASSLDRAMAVYSKGKNEQGRSGVSSKGKQKKGRGEDGFKNQ